MRKSFENLPESVKATIKASAPLAVVIILFILVANFGIPRVAGLRDQVTTAQSLKATLSQKLSVLQSFSQSSASGSVTAAVTALPDANPSAIVVSQLKNLASGGGVNISGIKSGSGSTTSSLSGINTSFQATGPRDAVINYLKNIETIAPITVVSSIRLIENAGVATADVSVVTYWAPNPTVIPSVTQPITDLSASEKQELTQIAGLIQPTVVQSLPSETGVNPAPFGQ
jgi:hypothetical protein